MFYYLTIFISGFIVLLSLAFIAFEFIYRARDKKGIYIDSKSKWTLEENNEEKRVYKSIITLKNINTKYEATLASVNIASEILFNKEKKDNLNLKTELITNHEYTRKDGYFTSYIIKPLNKFELEIKATFTGNVKSVQDVHAVRFRLTYSIYDRIRFKEKFEDIIFVPIQDIEKTEFIQKDEGEVFVYPVKTHLLSDSDKFEDVINKYAKYFLKKGDIVTIAESVVAIVQGRFVHPLHIRPNWWAKRLCYFVPNVGSLSTPTGMQCAMNDVGTAKMVFAMFIGAIMKVFGKRGWLYIIAGIQSELIDDLTGTIPPYDRYIVLGPKEPEKFSIDLKNKLGVDIAIVDANDLKKAKVVACSNKEMEKQIEKWMRSNPAGNSSEQTPIVIIRPKNVQGNL